MLHFGSLMPFALNMSMEVEVEVEVNCSAQICNCSNLQPRSLTQTWKAPKCGCLKAKKLQDILNFPGMMGTFAVVRGIMLVVTVKTKV